MPFKKKNYNDYNVEFFPITKVYLGNRMERERRREIMDFCNDSNIPYVGVMKNSDVYEMQECSLKCEEYFKYKSSQN